MGQDETAPGRKWGLAVVNALLIGYASNPALTILMSIIGIPNHLGLLFGGMTLVFIGVLAWNLLRPGGEWGLERSAVTAGVLFLAGIPGAILTGLLLPDAKEGAVLIVIGMLLSGYYFVQGILFLIWGAMLRRRRLEPALRGEWR